MNKFYTVIGLDGEYNTMYNSKCSRLDIIEINNSKNSLLYPISDFRMLSIYKTTMVWRIR